MGSRPEVIDQRPFVSRPTGHFVRCLVALPAERRDGRMGQRWAWIPEFAAVVGRRVTLLFDGERETVYSVRFTDTMRIPSQLIVYCVDTEISWDWNKS